MGVRFDFRVPDSLDFTGLLENSILIAVADKKHRNGVHLCISFCKELRIYAGLCGLFNVYSDLQEMYENGIFPKCIYNLTMEC